MISTSLDARRDRRAALLLSLLAVAAFLPALQNGFVYDDEHYVLNNPFVASWSLDHLRAMLTEPYFGNFHPLHHLLLALQGAVFGLWAPGWHAVSLLLHALNVALLHGLLRRLGVAPAAALGGTALFAIHPVQAESVAWVSEQKNLLSLLFVLLSFGAYLRARVSGRAVPLAASLAAFLAALAAKVSAVGLVPVILWIEWSAPIAAGGRRGGRLVRAVPFLVAGGAWAVLGILAHGGEGFIHPYPGGSLAAALLSLGPVLAAYAGNLLWPLDLSVAYDLPAATGMGLAPLAGAWVAVLAGTAWIVRLARRRPGSGIGLGLIWTAGFLLPVLNLIPIGTLMNDRYLYAPLCAIGPLLAGGLLAAARGIAGRAAGATPALLRGAGAAAALGLVVALGTLSAGRAAVWADDGSLWRDAAARSPASGLAQFNLGTWWLEQGRVDRAEAPLRAALEADPTLTRAYRNLGVVYFRQGRFRLAAAVFEAGTRLAPEDFDLWMNLGTAWGEAGRSEAALSAFGRAAALRPGAGAPLLAAGLLEEGQGDPRAAREAFRAFLASGDGSPSQRQRARERLRNLEERFRNRDVSEEAGT